MNKWDRRFLGLAKTVATWSKDSSTRVGSVITDSQNRVISLGYNGPAKGLKDDDMPRNRRLMRAIHAESNAIMFAHRNLHGTTIYVTHPPCANCASLIVQAGISKVVIPEIDPEFLDRWRESVEESIQMFSEAGVVLCRCDHE